MNVSSERGRTILLWKEPHNRPTRFKLAQLTQGSRGSPVVADTSPTLKQTNKHTYTYVSLVTNGVAQWLHKCIFVNILTQILPTQLPVIYFHYYSTLPIGGVSHMPVFAHCLIRHLWDTYKCLSDLKSYKCLIRQWQKQAYETLFQLVVYIINTLYTFF